MPPVTRSSRKNLFRGGIHQFLKGHFHIALHFAGIDAQRFGNPVAISRIRFVAMDHLVYLSTSGNALHCFRQSAKPPKAFMLRSVEVEAIQAHYLVPRRHKVVQELLPGVLASINFREGPELGVRTEDEINPGAGPLEFAGCAITALEQVLVFRGCLPGGAHVKQIHEEVIGQRFWPPGKNAVLGLSEVGIQDPHTANQNRHLRGG